MVVCARAIAAGTAITVALTVGAALGEALPSKMIFFVSGFQCPEGSAPARDAAGRMLLVVNNTGDVGKTYGNPLGDQEDRTHSHSGTMVVNLRSASISGANGPNTQATGNSIHSQDITSGAGTSGLPFIQFLVCQAN